MEVRMADSNVRDPSARDVTINLRANRKQKSLIDRAAQAQGKNRSDFMLDASCREAASVLLDRCYFSLDASLFKNFVAALDGRPAANPRLQRLLTTRAPWDK
jgi:uncharacterized protein (DUF1778 family)